MLGCGALTEEKTDVRNRQSNVNEAEFSPSILLEKKNIEKKNEGGVFALQQPTFPSKCLLESVLLNTEWGMWSYAFIKQGSFIKQAKTSKSDDRVAKRHRSLCSR